jgi:phosphoribosylamine---glycine ligase
VMALATTVGAHMVVVGPEGPLVDGLVDELAVACPSVKVFGPTKAAAELEASKVWKRRLAGALMILLCGVSGTRNLMSFINL